VWVNRKVCGGRQVLEVEQIEKWREWQILGYFIKWSELYNLNE
jgi:hypothetical protein